MPALSDSEICQRFGPVFAEFDEAIRADVWLLVEIVERMQHAQRVREEKAERTRQQQQAIRERRRLEREAADTAS